MGNSEQAVRVKYDIPEECALTTAHLSTHVENAVSLYGAGARGDHGQFIHELDMVARIARAMCDLEVADEGVAA